MTSISSRIGYITAVPNTPLTASDPKTLRSHVKSRTAATQSFSSQLFPRPHAIISNALGYILLIVDSSDPNLF